MWYLLILSQNIYSITHWSSPTFFSNWGDPETTFGIPYIPNEHRRVAVTAHTCILDYSALHSFWGQKLSLVYMILLRARPYHRLQTLDLDCSRPCHLSGFIIIVSSGSIFWPSGTISYRSTHLQVYTTLRIFLSNETQDPDPKSKIITSDDSIPL